jgi:ABC-2 type transport system permease protein
MVTASANVRSSRDQYTMRSRVLQILTYRELLVGLVRKELRVRYKNSVLGFVWSLVNPAVTIGVYAVIFGLVFPNSIHGFVIFLMSSVLLWNMFATALSSAVSSVVGNAPLVKKVWFPREILPLAAIGAAMVDFFLQSLVLVAALAIVRWPVGWRWLPLLPAALITTLLFTTALAVWLAAVNVRYRDVQHFLGIALMVWFWGTPIIYSFSQIKLKLEGHHLGNLLYLNPFTSIALCFQRVLYNDTTHTVAAHSNTARTINGVRVAHPDISISVIPRAGYPYYLGLLAVVCVFSIVLLAFTSRVFRRMEGDFAEVL